MYISESDRSMYMFRAGMVLFFACAGLLFLATRVMSVVMTDRGGDHEYATNTASVVICAGAVVALIVAICLMGVGKWSWKKLFALVPLLFAIALGCATYMMATDRVIVGQKLLMLPARGFPFHAPQEFAYDDLKRVTIRPTGDADTGREEVELERSDGSKVVVPMGDLARAARQDMTKILTRKGIPLTEIK